MSNVRQCIVKIAHASGRLTEAILIVTAEFAIDQIVSGVLQRGKQTEKVLVPLGESTLTLTERPCCVAAGNAKKIPRDFRRRCWMNWWL
jgi:hypothetical protein